MFHPGVDDVRHFLAEQAGMDPDEIADLIYTYHEDAAVAHLFGVAAGLDSMLIGESEILGQVREAWQVAEREGAIGQLLSRTFRQAVEVGKRARTETSISRHGVSIPSAAVTLAGERLGSLEGRRVLVVGAGGVGEGMAIALSGAGVGEIVVANRTARDRAAPRRAGSAVAPIALDEIAEELVRADVLLSCTGASDVLVERSDVEAVMAAAGRSGDARRRRRRSPRRRPGCRRGVRRHPPRHRRPRARRAIARCSSGAPRSASVREIITDELDRFRVERSAREVAPLVTALRERAEEIRRAEVERPGAKLDAGARAVLESVTQRLVNKLLHDPTVRLKDAAGTARGELFADAVAELFALDPPDEPPSGD